MVDRQTTADRDKLDTFINRAEDQNVMTQEEVGFVVMLVERFRSDLDAKLNQIQIIQGEINQLKANERIIMELIKNMISAADREVARLEAEAKLRNGG